MIKVVSVEDFKPTTNALCIGLDTTPVDCIKITGLSLEPGIINFINLNNEWCSDNIKLLIKQLYLQGIKALQMFKDSDIILVYRDTAVGSAFKELLDTK